MVGAGGDPLLTGNIKVAGFDFGGFPFGDIQSAKVRFKPLWLEAHRRHRPEGPSTYKVPTAKLDFDTEASIR